MAGETEFLVGTASWTDPRLVKSDLFYPPSLKTAEQRLRFYAEQFKTVEVDASYYTIVAERYQYLYSERELADWVGRIKQLRGVRRASMIFNNCYRNFGIMNATTMRHMLG
jgi:uncharacterized protein YecE (DUF72 family)